MELNDLLGFGKLAEAMKEPIVKLIEVCHSGIGKLYEPTHIKRVAKSRAEEIKIISNAIRENLDLPSKYIEGNFELDAMQYEELYTRMHLRLDYQEICKQNNIETVILGAANCLNKIESVSPEPVDKDWIVRFFNIVSDISNEKMQIIWSKILAGEIESPGSFTLRTLDVLRNISQKEAEIFVKIANYVIYSESDNDYCIFWSENSNNHFNYDEIFLLDEAGILSTTHAIAPFKFINTARIETCIYNDIKIDISKINDENKANYGFTAFILTNAGIELYRLLSDLKCDKKYLEDWAQNLREQGLIIEYKI